MSGPHPAVARRCGRRCARAHRAGLPARYAAAGGLLRGADSMALALAATAERRAPTPAAGRAAVVATACSPAPPSAPDHRRTARRARGPPPTTPGAGHRHGRVGGGARRARYAALRPARPSRRPVLLGHTLDDQARRCCSGSAEAPPALDGRHDELTTRRGCGRCSGARATTRAACAAWGCRCGRPATTPNPRFTRVRLRTEAPCAARGRAGRRVPRHWPGRRPSCARTGARRRVGRVGPRRGSASPSRPPRPPPTQGEAQVELEAKKLAAIRPRSAAVLRSWLIEAGALGPDRRPAAPRRRPGRTGAGQGG